MVVFILSRAALDEYVAISPAMDIPLTPSTAYGRVANLRSDDLLQNSSRTVDEKDPQHSLVDHFLTLTLAVLFQSGLPKVAVSLRTWHLRANQ